jgi:hypothetical protein
MAEATPVGEGASKKPVKRRTPRAIKVYCPPTERAELEAKAKSAGMSVSRYLAAVGIGYPVKTVLDHQRVEDLMRIDGNLGRLGGLLKLWLTDDHRTRAFGAGTVRALLHKIEGCQEEMLSVMRQVVAPKGRGPG